LSPTEHHPAVHALRHGAFADTVIAERGAMNADWFSGHGVAH